MDSFRPAVGACEPVTVAGRAHWPTGWLHHLNAADVDVPTHEAAPAEQLGAELTAHMEGLVERLGRDRQLTKAEVTTSLTETVVGWA